MPPPFNPRCSPKRVIMKMIYAAGAGRKRRSETVLIRRHLRKGSGGVRREVLTGAKLLLGYSGGGGGDKLDHTRPDGHTSRLSTGLNCITINTASWKKKKTLI